MFCHYNEQCFGDIGEPQLQHRWWDSEKVKANSSLSDSLECSQLVASIAIDRLK